MSTVGFGIDFGTTNSVVSAYDGRSLTSFMDNKGLPHPSVIWFRGDGEEKIVGREAKDNIKSHGNMPGNKFITSIKSKIQNQEEVEIFGRPYYNWQIASEIFNFLRRDTKSRFTQFPEISEAVVTVPLYFGGRQRQAIRQASEKAGIRVKAFIHEPFAAAIGYLYGQYGLNQLKDLRENILVFDWGGGTLDITLAKVDNGTISEISNAGFPGRSGDHFDENLMSYLTGKFLEDEGIPSEKFYLDRGVAGIFQNEAEFSKIGLSIEDESSIGIFDFFELDGHSYDLFRTIGRHEFEQVIRDDIDLAINNLRKVLDNSRTDVSQVSKVLLVGGTSQIPLLRKTIYEIFGISRVVNLDNSATLISEGAAIISHHNWKPFLVNAVCLQLSDDSHIPIFEPGTILDPKFAEDNKTFFCTDNRDGEAHFIISEDIGMNEYKVKKILSVPVSKTLIDAFEEKLYVNCAFDEDLIFRVSARSSVKGESRQSQIHDVCYGLRFA
ncbi:MAG: Hsp70 family protein [Nodosilinea sp.]